MLNQSNVMKPMEGKTGDSRRQDCELLLGSACGPSFTGRLKDVKSCQSKRWEPYEQFDIDLKQALNV